MPDLAFAVPTSLDDALQAVSGEGTFALGGGTAMALLLKNRLIDPEGFVYLARVPELQGIRRDEDGSIVLGASTTLREIVDAPLVREHLAVLSEATGKVGNPRVRSIATLGGAIVHADPRQDVPPVLTALGGRARVVGPAGERSVELHDFFLGFMETAVGEDEIVVDVTVPVEAGLVAEYSRFTPQSLDDYPTVGVAAALAFELDGTVRSARVTLGGVGPAVITVEEAGGLLVGRRPSADDIAAVAEAAAASTSPSDDQRGSAGYKTAMTEVWTRRTLERCLARAPGA